MNQRNKGNDGQVDNARGEPMAMTNVRRKKTTPEGYARADTLDNQKLRKYAKALAKEAELYRNARKE